MKYVPFKDSADGKFKARQILEGLVSQAPPGRGIDIAEQRRRCRLLDEFERAGDDGVSLEDADFDLLKRIVSESQFMIAHPALLAILDAVLTAKDVPVVRLDAAE